MRGHQFRNLLADIRNVVGVAGSKKHVEALQSAETALSQFDNVSVDTIVSRVETVVSDLTKPSWAKRLQQLEDAGVSEADFLRAFDELRQDRTVKKPELLKIASVYVGYADKKLSSDKLLEAIKTRFFAKVYDRDANEMAKRATPW
jgi:NurA-like 5'-3' nuclease